MIRRNTLERRLFVWLLVLGLLPPLVLVGALAAGAGWYEWLGTLGPWERVGESGRALIEAAGPAAANDPTLAEAVTRHERELSQSLVQANRWAFLGNRLIPALSIVGITLVLLLALIAALVARRLAVTLSRPIRELVEWSDRLARAEPLPARGPAERREVLEMQTLRAALRDASVRIEEGRTRAVEAARLRSWGEMARRVAHEMKNPLTPLRLAAHRLSRHEGDEIVREAAEVIGEETARLDEMARQFGALGRPPEGPASEVDVAELLAGLLETDVPPAIHHTLVDRTGTSTIVAHYDALLRAFRNLVRNAVESVQESGGRIEVAVDADPDGGVVVRVADDGAGFPEGLAERIFEPDFTLKAGGTGLGLAVVRQTVLQHGGRVTARSRPGGGAEFTVRLAAEPAVRNGHSEGSDPI